MRPNVQGNALRYRLQAMVNQGFSQREIARRSGLGRGTIYGILHGEHGASAGRASAALNSLNKDYRINVLTSAGTEWLEPTNQRYYSLNGKYWNAIEKVVHSIGEGNPDFSPLKPFRGRSIEVIRPGGGKMKVQLLSDKDAATIRQLFALGELDPVEVTKGGSGLGRKKAA